MGSLDALMALMWCLSRSVGWWLRETFMLLLRILTTLAARLQKVVPKVVSQAQTSFILGRYIMDNVLPASELIRGYNFAQISPRCFIEVVVKDVK